MKQKLYQISKLFWKDLWNYKEVILIFAAYYIIMHVVFNAFCPLVLTTGLPCAGCGMTRAVFFMITGQFSRSFRLNPMALPVILFAAYSIFTRYILNKKVKGFKIGIIILCAGMLIAYIYRMVTVFPNRPPYVYTANNLMEKCIPYYREILHKLLGI